jgi:hypothetical protein
MLLKSEDRPFLLWHLSIFYNEIIGLTPAPDTCPDHIIDMGPGGGINGGTVVASGTPEKVAKCARSYTGQYLKEELR